MSLNRIIEPEFGSEMEEEVNCREPIEDADSGVEV